MKLVKCLIYLVIISILSFFVGRILPKKWFRFDLFPYRTYKFERNGKIYEKLRIRAWYNRVPDMSKIVPFMMPSKKLTENSLEKLPRMIQETCVAEFIHAMNGIAGFFCLVLYPGVGGVTVAVIYAVLFNLPYVLIQRYNRPRLVSLYQKSTAHTARRAQLCEKGAVTQNVNVDTQL